MTVRLCRTCQIVKPEDSYWPSLPSRCKDCDRAKKKEYRARNAEKIAAYWREYRIHNPQRIASIQNRHYEANRERWSGKQKLRHERQQRVESTPYEREKIFERDGHRCQICGAVIDMALRHPDFWSPTLDHKIPLSAGGADTPENVQATHRICNLRKGVDLCV